MDNSRDDKLLGLSLAGGETLAWLAAAGSFAMARSARNDYAAHRTSSLDATEGWYIGAGVAVAAAIGIKAVGMIWAWAHD